MADHAASKPAPNKTPPLPFNNFFEVSRHRAKIQPDHTAYTYLRFIGKEKVEQNTLSYAALDRKAKQIAARLQAMVAPGARVLLVYPSGLEFIAAFFGCLYAGVVAVPVYPPTSLKQWPRFAKIAQDCQATGICTVESYEDKLALGLKSSPGMESMQCLSTDRSSGVDATTWRNPDTRSSDLAFLQYTSGTTGVPKGVMVTHGNLLHNQRMIETALGHGRESVGVSWLPLYHDMGLIGAVLQPLYCGFPVILMSPLSFMQDPFRWLKTVSEFKATSSAAPNFAYELCVRRITAEQKKTLDLTHWRNAFNGAEQVRAETLKRFAEYFAECGFERDAIRPGYGMAEATLMVTSSLEGKKPSEYEASASALAQNRRRGWRGEPGDKTVLVGCGRPIQQDVAIVDPTTRAICEPDQIGEIWVRGPNVSQGYWGRKSDSDSGFDAFTSDSGEGPYFRTGDLGFLHRSELFVTGRLKELIIIRGRNFYPHDIEAAAQSSHSSLRTGRGAAFSITVNGEECAVLVQELKTVAGNSIDIEEVKAAIRMAVAEQQSLPLHDIVLLKQGHLPLTSSGKIRRHECRIRYLNQALTAEGRIGVESDKQDGALELCPAR